jgi:hypothetical protein
MYIGEKQNEVGCVTQKGLGAGGWETKECCGHSKSGRRINNIRRLGLNHFSGGTREVVGATGISITPNVSEPAEGGDANVAGVMRIPQQRDEPVGARGFEPPTSCSQSKRSSRAELRPEDN